jgi:para-aminobenzoate synthetase
VRTLLIDNHDSFTFNLFQLLAEVGGEEPVVLRTDERGWEELVDAGRVDNIVLSPGAGRPDRERDFGVCAEIIRRAEVPVLGVCLGHQGLCTAYGGRLVQAEPMHGRTSTIEHTGLGLFAGLPERFEVTRYHSFRVETPLPAELEAHAWTLDGTLMAVAHRTRPQWGVQFHPESISTEHGREMLERFRDLTASRTLARSAAATADARPVASAVPTTSPAPTPTAPLALRWRRLDFLPDPERAFAALFGASPEAFWLDGDAADERSRFSFMGDPSGPVGRTITHDVRDSAESIFDRLARETRRAVRGGEELPFDFDCGLAGYLGYELKAECGGADAHRSDLPDAFFIFADRMVALDRVEGAAYVLALAEEDRTEEPDEWIAATAELLRDPPPLLTQTDPPGGSPARREPAPVRDPRALAPGAAEPASADPFRVTLARNRERYLADVEACRQELRDGESYEICLTDRVVAAPVERDPFDLYRALRAANPAPFSAYLRMGDVAVLSSSPERFLSIDRDGAIEARPIKGTIRRDADEAEDRALAERLGSDPKSRAENLIVCDLLRNDIGICAEVGSVHVPQLIGLETYATVHQLVSVVRARLKEGLTAPDCVRACFPPGSMTGAPKERTMEIIDRLEGEARGVYSGAIGWFGLSGACDLSVVIRTIVLTGGTASIGVGGAVVAESDPEEEFREILLKAEAPLAALSRGAGAGAVTGR